MAIFNVGNRIIEPGTWPWGYPKVKQEVNHFSALMSKNPYLLYYPEFQGAEVGSLVEEIVDLSGNSRHGTIKSTSNKPAMTETGILFDNKQVFECGSIIGPGEYTFCLLAYGENVKNVLGRHYAVSGRYGFSLMSGTYFSYSTSGSDWYQTEVSDTGIFDLPAHREESSPFVVGTRGYYEASNFLEGTLKSLAVYEGFLSDGDKAEILNARPIL
jgi:hypothetical protein